MKKCAGLVMGFVLASVMAVQAAVTVSNVTAAQTPGTKQVVVTYDVTSTETNAVGIVLSVSNGASAVTVANATGHIGAGVATGTGKTITWNAGADWNGNVASLVYTVLVVPEGGDTTAVSWTVVNERWVKNTYANGDITMSDRTTGLMWLFDASLGGTRNWNNAKNYCDNLTYAGHTDWRLPYVNQQDGPFGPVRPEELEEMFGQKSLFSGVQDYYWSGTSNKILTSNAYVLNMGSGIVGHGSKTTFSHYVWPVRGGQ